MRVDPNYVRNLAAAVNQSSSLEESLTSELSSGLSVSSLQDNPVAVAQSTLLGSAISADDSYVQSATGIQSMLQVTDSTLGEVVTQLTSAVSLAVQGNGGTLDSANIAAIGQQLTGIRDQVLSLANTSYQGSYLFSGSQGSVQPFSINSSTTPATANYAGDSQVEYVQTPTGQRLQTNLPGSLVFGNSSSGVLSALNNLIADFSVGAAGATATADISALSTALGQVTTQRSILDNSLSQVISTSSAVLTNVASLTAQQGSLVSADTATVATQLSSAETQHQALLSVISALSSTNLFSYLKP